jgi:hypothetical protein
LHVSSGNTSIRGTIRGKPEDIGMKIKVPIEEGNENERREMSKHEITQENESG